MDSRQFEAVVARHEAFAALHPSAFRTKVAAVVALGYAFLGSMLLIGLAVLVADGFFAYGLYQSHHVGYQSGKAIIAFAFVGGLLAWAAFRSLWVSLGEDPRGILVTPRDAPELFALIGKLRAQHGAPKIHRVVVDDQMNAAMAQVPRLGIFGWPRNTLILGMPLLMSLSTEEMSSVIAHELGHAAGAHGKFGAWIYRIRMSWDKFAQTVFSNDGWAFAVPRFFLRWFWPRLNALAFVLSRRQEYEADRVAVATSGPAARTALVRLQAVAQRDGKAFDDLEMPKIRRELPAPPLDMMERRARYLDAMPAQEAQKAVIDAWSRPTDCADTHPALRDRIVAMGGADALPHVPAPAARKAHESFFTSEARVRIVRALSERWRDSVLDAWSEMKAAVAKQDARFSELDAKADKTPAERFEMAQIKEDTDGFLAAKPLYEISAAENFVSAKFRLVRYRLEQGDRTAAAEFEPMIATNRDNLPAVAELAIGYYASQKDGKQQRHAWEERLETYAKEMALMDAERAAWPKPEKMAPHALKPEHVEKLSKLFSGSPVPLEGVWVVGVTPKYRPDLPWTALLIRFKTSFFTTDKDEALQKADAKLGEYFSASPEGFDVFSEVSLNLYVHTQMKKECAAADKVPGARIPLAAKGK